jgi:hypothetical protein
LRHGLRPYTVDGGQPALTPKALCAFQHDQHLAEAGTTDAATLARLSVAPPAAESATPSPSLFGRVSEP